MKNIRSKKLLACFLTALGLSMNSMNSADVSAKHGQIRENIKFYLDIKSFIENYGRGEIAQHTLDGQIQNFVKNGELTYKIIDEKINYSYIALKLYEFWEANQKRSLIEK